MKKILVTGGAGYIGSTLIRQLLRRNYNVRVLDALRSGGESLLSVLSEPNFEFVKGDIREEETTIKALKNIDTVVHLAAIVGQPACKRNPEEAYEINQKGTINVFEKAEEKGVPKFIFASTCSNYGMLEGEIATEDSAVEPTSLYANTKIASEKYLLSEKTRKCKPIILRFATVFGLSPKMRMDLLVHEFLRDAISKNEILVYGPEFWRPFCHVKDIARAIIACIEAPVDKTAYEIFNVGGDENNIRKLDLGKLIGKYVPDANLKVIKTEKDLRNYRVSFDKISKTLNYNTTKTIEDGIREVKNAIFKGVIDPFDDRWYYKPLEV